MKAFLHSGVLESTQYLDYQIGIGAKSAWGLTNDSGQWRTVLRAVAGANLRSVIRFTKARSTALHVGHVTLEQAAFSGHTSEICWIQLTFRERLYSSG